MLKAIIGSTEFVSCLSSEMKINSCCDWLPAHSGSYHEAMSAVQYPPVNVFKESKRLRRNAVLPAGFPMQSKKNAHGFQARLHLHGYIGFGGLADGTPHRTVELIEHRLFTPLQPQVVSVKG